MSVQVVIFDNGDFYSDEGNNWNAAMTDAIAHIQDNYPEYEAICTANVLLGAAASYVSGYPFYLVKWRDYRYTIYGFTDFEGIDYYGSERIRFKNGEQITTGEGGYTQNYTFTQLDYDLSGPPLFSNVPLIGHLGTLLVPATGQSAVDPGIVWQRMR